MCLSFETLTSIIRTGLHIPVELIDLVNSVQLRWLTFLRGSQTDSHSPAVLDFFLSSDAIICSKMALTP